MWSPSDVVFDKYGNWYIADLNNHRVRKVSAGFISTVAGTGAKGHKDGPALQAQLELPWGVVYLAGKLYFDEVSNSDIRELDLTTSELWQRIFPDPL